MILARWEPATDWPAIADLVLYEDDDVIATVWADDDPDDGPGLLWTTFNGHGGFSGDCDDLEAAQGAAELAVEELPDLEPPPPDRLEREADRRMAAAEKARKAHDKRMRDLFRKRGPVLA